MPLIDSFGRTIDYLRVSVTDRCNFRCVYCMPEDGAPVAPKAEILTYEEIVRLAAVAAALGVRNVRITGGEPLIRKDILSLIQALGRIHGIEDLSLTTNGLMLPKLAGPLAAAGLKRVNISLDTLREERFTTIARRGNLADVTAGIAAAERAGLAPLKLNMVVMRGLNDDEVVDFARQTLQHRWDVRFIELMPVNWSSGDGGMADYFALSGRPAQGRITLFADADTATFRRHFHLAEAADQKGMLDAAEMRRRFVSSAETRERIEQVFGPLQPADVLVNGPARSFRIDGAAGTVGFISQITNDHCARCNRLRLTADGMLRPCLMADGEVDLKTPLRSGAEDEAIAELFRMTVRHKPYEHRLEDGLAPIGRGMSRLGG